MTLELTSINHFVYQTEELGYLPFGFYHWINVNGVDISKNIPADWALDWSRRDLSALEEAGLIETIKKWEDPKDEYHTKTTFRLIVEK